MGDRTYTTITVKKQDCDLLVKEFGGTKELEEKSQIDEVRYEGDVSEFVDDQANYGEMPELENILAERKIQYNKRWEAGGDYPSGEEFARNVKGKYMMHMTGDVEQAKLDTIKELQEMLSQGSTLAEVQEHLEKEREKLEPFEVTPLNNPNSIDFIKED